MDKVKLPKRIFLFIQSERFVDTYEQNHWKERVLLQILTHEFSLEEVKFETIVQALANDYEVEETPEDKVREYFNDIAQSSGRYTPEEVNEIIINVLNDLNIKIVGVNHD